MPTSQTQPGDHVNPYTITFAPSRTQHIPSRKRAGAPLPATFDKILAYIGAPLAVGVVLGLMTTNFVLGTIGVACTVVIVFVLRNWRRNT